MSHSWCKHGIPWDFCEECNRLSESAVSGHFPMHDPVDKGKGRPKRAMPRFVGQKPLYGVENTLIGAIPSVDTSDGGSSAYYDLPPNCQTLQDIIVKQGMDFTRGNIFKAVYRWDVKPGLEYNLRKIQWFVDDALQRLYAEERIKVRGPD